MTEEKKRGKLHPLVRYPNPLLNLKAEEFDFANPPTDPIQLAYDLVECMIQYGGIGISSCQIGLPYRAFALKAKESIVCFNPKVVDVFGTEVLMEEGCLSFPFAHMKIKRMSGIRVRYTEPNGNVVTTKMEGLTARCFLHELDHLDGKTFLDRASFIQKERASKQMKKYERMRKKYR